MRWLSAPFDTPPPVLTLYHRRAVHVGPRLHADSLPAVAGSGQAAIQDCGSAVDTGAPEFLDYRAFLPVIDALVQFINIGAADTEIALHTVANHLFAVRAVTGSVLREFVPHQAQR